MAFDKIEDRLRSRSRWMYVAADVSLAFVLLLITILMLKPRSASSLDVPFKLIIPLSAILLLVRAFASSKEQS